MAFLGQQAFDPSTAPVNEFEAIPAGEYTALIVDSTMKQTNDKTGQYLELTHQIVDGQFKGRKVWARLNLVNRNETAVRIAQQQLGEIAKSVGYMQPFQDSQVLHNKPCVIRVEFVPADASKNRKYDQNEIKAWKSTGAQVATVPAQFAAQAPANASVPAWAQGAR